MHEQILSLSCCHGVASQLDVFSCGLCINWQVRDLYNILQKYQFCYVWVIKCFVRSDLITNLSPQVVHGYDSSPLWLLMWTFKLHPRVKLFPQVLQEKGRSPVCILVILQGLSRTNTFPKSFARKRSLARVYSRGSSNLC